MPSLTKLTKEILKIHGLSPKNYLSQNFLVDKNIYKKIIKAAELVKDDQVIEIGPGLGFLTNELLQISKRVAAIEIDKDLFKALEQLKPVSSNLTLINGDIIKVDLEKMADFSLKKPYKLVANIPYHLTAKIIKKFLTLEHKPQTVVLLVQKEVAERVLSGPGKHSLLSLSVQYYGEPKIVSIVSKRCFYPSPRVDSAILKIKINKEKIKKSEEELFWKIVKFGFAGKRKKLVNNLANGLGKDKQDMEKIFSKLKIDTGSRAQHLTLDDWKNLLKEI